MGSGSRRLVIMEGSMSFSLYTLKGGVYSNLALAAGLFYRQGLGEMDVAGLFTAVISGSSFVPKALGLSLRSSRCWFGTQRLKVGDAWKGIWKS